MNNAARMQAFLRKLWELQAEAGLTDKALARDLGVDQALVSRAKRHHAQTVGIKFVMGACDRFPELRLLLFPEVRILTKNMRIRQEEAAS